MGAATLASAFLVLELGAFFIYDGIKNLLTHAQRGASGQQGGGESDHLTKLTLRNTNI